MHFFAVLRAGLARRWSRTAGRVFSAASLAFFLAVAVSGARAAAIHGTVTDASGAKITGAKVALFSKGKVVANAVSTADGSFQLLTGGNGRYYLIVSSPGFRQLETPGFYASRLDSIERNLVLEPEWVRESIVVTATGIPTPQSQTSAATSVLGPLDIALRDDFVGALRLMPGTFTVQAGQRGSQGSLFIRGGDSDDNKILFDGVSAGDLGGRFDFGSLSTSSIERAEIYRGTDSGLYGADAESGVVSFTTPRGTTSFPSLIFEGDAGNFSTSHEQFELAGTHNKFDYLGSFSWFQTSNSLPMDEFHVATTAANFGWQPSAATQIRGTLHYGVSATGVPNAWQFYHVADSATQEDQDTFLSASIDNQTMPQFHNSVRYGLSRKREQYNLWQQRGSGYFDPFGSTLGQLVTITGANGYSATGRAVLDYAGTYPQGHQLVSNRDQLLYQGDYRITPHLSALAGFHFEDERGAEPGSTYYLPIERTNYDYLASVHGDFKNRFFYTLGGSLEHYSLFGTQTTPRAGSSFYALRPRKGVFSGTRILFNYGDAVREPALTDQEDSLYSFLIANGGQSTIRQLHLSPLSAPTARTYEGGGEQSFLSQRIVFRVIYFHNEFGRQIEYVGPNLIPLLLPNLTPAEQNLLQQFLQQSGAYSLTVNTEAFRAQGIESTVEGGIGGNIFLRGGYTYLDGVVQRSFDSDNQALTGGQAPTFGGIPIGAISPLRGARPFRRPPHTGFLSASYASRRFTALFTSAFASRSDDSTYLENADANDLNTLLLPNRNLDHGYAKLDLGGSYQWSSWLGIYAQAENLTSNQHIAPIGYISLPMNFRAGLRIQVGKAK